MQQLAADILGCHLELGKFARVWLDEPLENLSVIENTSFPNTRDTVVARQNPFLTILAVIRLDAPLGITGLTAQEARL